MNNTMPERQCHPMADPRKRLDTLRARLALRGYELRDLPAGGHVVVRWLMSRELLSLDAVEAFAGQVGA